MDKFIDDEVETNIAVTQKIVKPIREIRSQYNIPPKNRLIASASAPKQTADMLNANAELICSMAVKGLAIPPDQNLSQS